MKRTLAMLTIFGLGAVWANPAFAQSLSSGSAAGRVVDESGVPLFDAEVTLSTHAGGRVGGAITDRAGRFQIPRIAAGEYQLYVEAVGFRPTLLPNVPVDPGIPAPYVVVLKAAAPPVVGVDTLGASVASVGRVRPGESHWLSGGVLDGLPDRDRSLANLIDMSAIGDGLEGMNGLPGSMTTLYIDGLPTATARIPGFASDPLFGLVAPRLSLSGVQLVHGGGESEWLGGPVVSAVTRQAGSQFSIDAFADYSGGSLWSSGSVTDVPAHQNLRGGAVVELPIVADSASLRAGVEVFRLERIQPALLAEGSAPGWLASALPATSSLDAPSLAPFEAVTGFVRGDMALSRDTRASVRAHVASISDPEPTLAPFLGGPSHTGGRDASISGLVDSNLSDTYRLEIKAGGSQSRRSLGEGAASGLPYTAVAELPFAVGQNAVAPASVEVSRFDLMPNLHGDFGEHRVKLGASASLASHTFAQSPIGSGWFGLSGGPDAGWVRDVTGQGETKFTLATFGLYAQDTWNAGPGVQLQFGARADFDRFPESDITTIPTLWDSLAVDPGVRPADSVPMARSFSTRISLLWDVGERSATFIGLGAGLSYEPIDAGLIHEWINGDGRRRLLDTTADGAWPEVANGPSAPWLTLWSGAPERARTARAHASLTHTLGAGLALRLGASFRRTEGLARRSDLNLTPNPSAVDQFGRPVYGALGKTGATLFAQPTLNRRFVDLAVVDVLVPDGWSEYQDVSIGVERVAEGSLSFSALYSFSRTQDNMVGWGQYDPLLQRSPFTGVEGFETWDDGRSDFDRPHRFFAGWRLAIPSLSGVHLAGAYRFRSGAPFTPGFRPGVDANGDGWAGNDPALSESGIASTGVAICDAPGVGGSFERNACRAPGVSSFDLRASARFAVGGSALEVVVDGLNLIEPLEGRVDQALWLVDATNDLSVQQGTVQVPLVANSGFGEWAVRQTPGRMIRVQLRVLR